MKKTTIAILLAWVAFAATNAIAQEHITLRFDAPFNFSVDGKHYSAGSYQLRTFANNTFEVCNIKTGDAGLVRVIKLEQANAGWNKTSPALRFAMDGERIYLTSLTDSEGNGWHVRGAEKEMEAARSQSAIVVALK